MRGKCLLRVHFCPFLTQLFSTGKKKTTKSDLNHILVRVDQDVTNVLMLLRCIPQREKDNLN